MPPSSLGNDTFTVFRGLEMKPRDHSCCTYIAARLRAKKKQALKLPSLQPWHISTLFYCEFHSGQQKEPTCRTYTPADFLCDSSFFCFSQVNKKNEKTCPTTTRISVSLRPCSHSDSSMHRTGSRLPTVEQSSASPTSLSHTLRDEIEPRNT